MHMYEEGRGGLGGGFEGSLLNPMWCTFLVKLIDIIICMRGVCANSTHTLAMSAHVFYGRGRRAYPSAPFLLMPVCRLPVTGDMCAGQRNAFAAHESLCLVTPDLFNDSIRRSPLFIENIR